MDPPYRGYGDYEQEEHRHPPFHHAPPPPPPGDYFDERPFHERRDDDDGGFPRRHSRPEEEGFGREDDDGGFARRHNRPEQERFGRDNEDEDDGSYGRRRADHEKDRFGRDEGYSPEDRPHFPHTGFGHCPSHTEGPPSEEYAPAPSDDFTHSSQHHSFMHFGSHQRPSDEPVAADPLPETGEAPPADAGLSSQMDSLSLDIPQGRLVRIFCKENSAFNLAVEHNSLEMQASNTDDESQHWIKDASHGMRVKDSYGYPAFSLVNKKTKKVLKHVKEQGQQVLVVDYQPDLKDDDILWTESQDFGEGFKTVRSAGDTLLNLTVFEGHKKIRNGSALMVDTWHKGDHQLWKLFPL